MTRTTLLSAVTLLGIHACTACMPSGLSIPTPFGPVETARASGPEGSCTIDGYINMPAGGRLDCPPAAPPASEAAEPPGRNAPDPLSAFVRGPPPAPPWAFAPDPLPAIEPSLLEPVAAPDPAAGDPLPGYDGAWGHDIAPPIPAAAAGEL